MLGIKGMIIAAGISLLVGISTGVVGTLKVTKAIKPIVKVECPSCPEQKPCNGIDYDKIKSKNLTIQNTQYLTVDGDSTALAAYIDALRVELKSLKLARCK